MGCQMSTSEPTFEQRLRKLSRKHRRMSDNGVVQRMGPDGLMIAYPRRRAPRFPWHALAIVLGAAFMVKAGALAALGPVAYEARVAAFAEGSSPERAAAFLLRADPATVAVAGLLERIGV